MKVQSPVDAERTFPAKNKEVTPGYLRTQFRKPPIAFTLYSPQNFDKLRLNLTELILRARVSNEQENIDRG